MNAWLLVPLHAGLGVSHQWFDQLMAIFLVSGLWLAATGFAERWQARQRPAADTDGDREIPDGEISSRRHYLRVGRLAPAPLPTMPAITTLRSNNRYS